MQGGGENNRRVNTDGQPPQIPELNFCRNLPNVAKIQNPAVTADKLQPTPDHITNAALFASSSARPKTAALRDPNLSLRGDAQEGSHAIPFINATIFFVLQLIS